LLVGGRGISLAAAASPMEATSTKRTHTHTQCAIRCVEQIDGGSPRAVSLSPHCLKVCANIARRKGNEEF
jgi:hypothetical protein